MKQYGIKGSFNINAGLFKDADNGHKTYSDRMSSREALKAFKNSGQEIALHGYYHDPLHGIPSQVVLSETLREREALEELFKTIIRGMAYPYGCYTKPTIEAIKAAGIVYSRTVNATGRFNVPVNSEEDWMELTTTCHFADPDAGRYADKFVENEPLVFPELFYVWGHSHEFNYNDGYNKMEALLKTVSGNEDVWYATSIEIYDYFHAYRRLQFTMKGNAVHNPNFTSVWLSYRGELYEIEPGKTIVFERSHV